MTEKSDSENESVQSSEATDQLQQAPTEQSEEDNSASEAEDVKQNVEETQAPAKEAKRGGGVLVWFVLLLALASIGGVGFLYYELIYQDHQAELRAQVAKVSEASGSDLGALERDLSERMAALEGQQKQALDQALTTFDERMDAAKSDFARSLGEAMNAAPPSEREWKLAEATYLLRVANHRLLMEQDARTALTMLEATDEILASLDDFSLHGVRAALADEIMSLKRVRGADVQGLYLTLEAVKNQLSTLPIAVPEYLETTPESSPPPEDADIWQVLSDRFFELFAFRQVGRDGVRPLLAPEEKTYLEQNIRLTIEQAQLAALKRHQDVWQASLTNAKTWVEAYLAGDSQDVADFVGVIDELLTVDLKKPMPDISGSFSALNDVLRGLSPEEAAADEGLLPEEVAPELEIEPQEEVLEGGAA